MKNEKKKTKQNKTKSMNLYNTSILIYFCMWNESNWNVLQLKL